MAIKFDDELNSEIRRTVRNFNAKVRRNKFKTRGKGMLPETISVRDLRAKYSDKTRNELKKQLKLYQSFGNRDALTKADSDSRLSKWEREYFESNLAKTREFYDKEIEDLQRVIGNQPEYHLRLHPRLNTLMSQRKELNKDLSELSETQIKGLRAYFNYAERSDLVKEQTFRTYLNQLDRTMTNLGYSKSERDALFKKFSQLTENEFTEMMNRENLIDRVYELIDSPKTRGEYELMADEEDARNVIESIINSADTLISTYKSNH